ncbi:MAG: ADP-ribosylglycohydrolase family protein [Marinovum algicola]
MNARTSFTHPLQIATLPMPDGSGGAVGVTFCPGKRDRHAATGVWDRDLEADLLVIRDWGASAVVTLMEDHELANVGVPNLGAAVEAMGMRWIHAPVVDVSVPGDAFSRVWASAGAEVRGILAGGGRVLVHCRGGLGRSGTLAACLLVEAGQDPEAAIAAVRAARPGAIETREQADHVRATARRLAAAPASVAGAPPVSPGEPALPSAANPTSSSPADDAGRRDRALGALVGLAVGDAIGTTLEFTARDSRPPLDDMIGGGPFHLAPGVWTDDTSMALCLADSLIARGTLEPADLMERFVAWWRNGENSPTGRCFDIGNTVRAALDRYRRTGEALAGSTDPHSAGNGSLMRLAPIALRWHGDEETAAAMAAEQSRTTHGAPAAVDACRAYARLLVRAINGVTKDAVLAPWHGADLKRLDPAVAAVLAGSWQDKPRAAIKSSGYVVHSLEAALWAVAGADDFRQAVLDAANLGDDADTVAAIAGQLAGALWGLGAIPGYWREQVAWRADIEARGERLVAAGTGSA